jgi:hypothetical protein
MTEVLSTSLNKSKTAGRRLARGVRSGVRSGTAATRERIGGLRHRGEKAHRARTRRRAAAGLAVPAGIAAAWAARGKLRDRKK